MTGLDGRSMRSGRARWAKPCTSGIRRGGQRGHEDQATGGELRRTGPDDRPRRSGRARWGRGRRRRRRGRPPLPCCAGGTLEQSPSAANLALGQLVEEPLRKAPPRWPCAPGPWREGAKLGPAPPPWPRPPSRPAPRPTPLTHSPIPPPPPPALPRRPSAWARKCAAASRSPGLRGSARAHLSRAPPARPRVPRCAVRVSPRPAQPGAVGARRGVVPG